jgi:hypothetical protein
MTNRRVSWIDTRRNYGPAGAAHMPRSDRLFFSFGRQVFSFPVARIAAGALRLLGRAGPLSAQVYQMLKLKQVREFPAPETRTGRDGNRAATRFRTHQQNVACSADGGAL